MLQTHPTERVQQANLLAQYELLQRLGGGERASVHLARDRVLQQRVAIKLFRDVWSRDPDRIAQLYGLARAAAALDSARIAAVYDHGTAWHAAFITNEYVPGHDLADLLPPGESLPPRRAATIVAQILEALMATHAAGLIHGDLHPSNVRLREESDAIALTDFGTASVFPLSDDDDHGPFRAPELSSAILTPMTDIYAVGALLRAMLPAAGSGAAAGNRTLVEGLQSVAARAAAYAPAERYPTAATMRDALLAVTGPLALPTPPLTAVAAPIAAPAQAGQPAAGGVTRRLRYGPLALAGVLVLGGIVGGGLLARERTRAPSAAPTALIAAQPSILPSATVLLSATVAPTAAPQPTATTASTTAPSTVPSAAPTTVAPVASTAPASAAPASAPAASASSASGAPSAAPTSAPAIASAAPSVAPTAPAIAPTASPSSAPAPTATAVVPTAAPVVGYTGTFGPDRLAGAYRRDDGTLYGRQNAVLYSVGTGYETGTLTFSVVQAPTEPLTLILTGLDDEVSGTNRLVATLNGTAIFDGPDTFPNTPASDHGVGGGDRYWGEMQIVIPAGVLQEGTNTLVLENAAPGGKLGTPYILINSVQFASPAAK